MKNRILLKYHSFFGILGGAFLLVLGITGTILVFNQEIDAAEFSKYEIESIPSERNIDKTLNTIQKEYKDWDTRLITFEPNKTLVFNLRSPNARKYVFVHPSSGKIIKEIDANSTITKWLLKLHYSLHAGVVGRFLILFAGIAFLLSIITGTILYRKVFWKTLAFKTKLKWSNKKNRYSVIHRYVGVWALLLNSVIVISGVFLAYKVATAGLKSPSEAKTPLIETSTEKLLAEIKNDYPDYKPTYLRFPTSEKGKIVVYGIFKNDPFYFSEFYNKIEADYKTGKIVTSVKIAEASIGTKLESMITPMHFGQFGGLPIKILYALVGLSGPFLSVTGFIIWLKRK
ncbi:PepSY-associated TM helix domain-containing protein [Galbibacter mesophilus]|uniref:PepSY-associated TM helix domain-containing protein n=1 Tax=Galbibacter mesophilus TaxID=379069 RepID=UPI00191D0AE0|nr:PepSY-associated TM helix domain-containing protein [Galbibacter mesophilus]MCM5662434.1 PepSY domain-containing protein [Galbibacter mesophilus]